MALGSAAFVYSAAPQNKTELIPDAGDDLTTVQAELVNRKVIEFLKGL